MKLLLTPQSTVNATNTNTDAISITLVDGITQL